MSDFSRGVPCVESRERQRMKLRRRMMAKGTEESLASSVSQYSAAQKCKYAI